MGDAGNELSRDGREGWMLTLDMIRGSSRDSLEVHLFVLVYTFLFARWSRLCWTLTVDFLALLFSTRTVLHTLADWGFCIKQDLVWHLSDVQNAWFWLTWVYYPYYEL